ncbi:hypothetical protein PTRG_05216 [Pyrenophora tritici-repentis Pt-1C-BFP]|uniref:Uncharacterized protein n=1 Tax=Pyrenophora tritici-repentis (strain Pt-1C-BFP) TaxID=426418 RepID=B2W416_PYRTR|nr:uncharacterized protein PTRG_05216 [Pyrenophora tritici-repentis Pt-1C-BFP]EDU48123.1 hypothetical protein PTRG_05216 [Pyrenophora tritici-repentis Pt-1C-BFP]
MASLGWTKSTVQSPKTGLVLGELERLPSPPRSSFPLLPHPSIHYYYYYYPI